jgi:hypothetical protein
MKMSIVEYVLLAILGSTPVAPGTSANVPPQIYDAESVAQPRGSAPREASYRSNKDASNSNKKSTNDNKNGKKPPEKGGKKSSGGGSTPPPK